MFKYDEGRFFIVEAKDRSRIEFKDASFHLGTATVEVNMVSGDLFKVYCFGGKFVVYNKNVMLRLTEKQLSMYFRKC